MLAIKRRMSKALLSDCFWHLTLIKWGVRLIYSGLVLGFWCYFDKKVRFAWVLHNMTSKCCWKTWLDSIRFYFALKVAVLFSFFCAKDVNGCKFYPGWMFGIHRLSHQRSPNFWANPQIVNLGFNSSALQIIDIPRLVCQKVIKADI